MADLTANAPLRFKGQVYSERFFIDTSTTNVFFRGQPVLIDQSADTQNATPYVDGLTVDPADVCLGIAAEAKSVVSGAAETTEIEVYVAPTWVGFKSAIFDNADLGKVVYKSDSDVLSETAADNPQLGILRKVEGGYAFVELTTPQICGGA